MCGGCLLSASLGGWLSGRLLNRLLLVLSVRPALWSGGSLKRGRVTICSKTAVYSSALDISSAQQKQKSQREILILSASLRYLCGFRSLQPPPPTSRCQHGDKDQTRLLTADLDPNMVQLCRGLGLPHGGLKAAVETRLRTKLTELQAATPTPTTTSTGPVTTPVAATITATTAPTSRVWPSYLGGSAPISPPPASHHAASRATGAGTSTQQHTTSPTPAPAANATPWCRNPAHCSHTAHGLPPPLSSTSSNTTVSWTMQRQLQPPIPGSSRPLVTLSTVLPQSATTTHPANVPTTAAPARPVTANPPYLPPAASPADIHALQMQLAATTPAPPLHRMGIPPLPARLQARVLAGEFIDMPDILHALELDAGEELPINLEVGEGHQLTETQAQRDPRLYHVVSVLQCVCSHHSVHPACS